MEEKYRDYYIRENYDPESFTSWFWAGPVGIKAPSFKSRYWPSDGNPEEIKENMENALNEVKQKIDRYYENQNDYIVYRGYITVEVPFEEIAKNNEEAIKSAKEYIEERLIAAVELIDYDIK